MGVKVKQRLAVELVHVAEAGRGLMGSHYTGLSLWYMFEVLHNKKKKKGKK